MPSHFVFYEVPGTPIPSMVVQNQKKEPVHTLPVFSQSLDAMVTLLMKMYFLSLEYCSSDSSWSFLDVLVAYPFFYARKQNLTAQSFHITRDDRELLIWYGVPTLSFRKDSCWP